MRITVLNSTGQSITCSWDTLPSRSIPSRQEVLIASPSAPIETELPRRCRHISLHSSGSTLTPSSTTSSDTGGQEGQDANTEIKPTGILTRISLTLSALWHVLDTSEDSPWRVYATKVSPRSDAFLCRDTYQLDLFRLPRSTTN